MHNEGNCLVARIKSGITNKVQKVSFDNYRVRVEVIKQMEFFSLVSHIDSCCNFQTLRPYIVQLHNEKDNVFSSLVIYHWSLLYKHVLAASTLRLNTESGFPEKGLKYLLR